jgi:hypothetical protein
MTDTVLVAVFSWYGIHDELVSGGPFVNQKAQGARRLELL